MKTRLIGMITGLAFVLLAAATSARAGDVSVRERLTTKATSIEAQLSGKTGARERQLLLEKRASIDAALRRLDAGQDLSREEMEQLTDRIQLSYQASAVPRIARRSQASCALDRPRAILACRPSRGASVHSRS